jgi:hypothetical protein
MISRVTHAISGSGMEETPTSCGMEETLTFYRSICGYMLCPHKNS